MLINRGTPALSGFRLQKLMAQLEKSIPNLEGVYAEYIHFADVEGELPKTKQKVLDKLLKYGPKSKPVEEKGQVFLVIPRPGTISPWSSKATNIAHNCGLKSIKRIERGVIFTIVAKNKLKPEQVELLEFDYKRHVDENEKEQAKEEEARKYNYGERAGARLETFQ